MTTKHKFKVGDRAYREPTPFHPGPSFTVAHVGRKWLTSKETGGKHAVDSCFPTQAALDARLAMTARRGALERALLNVQYTWHRKVLEEDIPELEAIFKRAGLFPYPR